MRERWLLQMLCLAFLLFNDKSVVQFNYQMILSISMIILICMLRPIRALLVCVCALHVIPFVMHFRTSRQQ